MWSLAEQATWSPMQSYQLTFAESALAMPRSAICAECEEEGKRFSKSQLARRPDERKCADCVKKNLPGASQSSSAVLGVTCAPILCCMCSTQLTATNCSQSQKQKSVGARKCNDCVLNSRAPTAAVSVPVAAGPHVSANPPSVAANMVIPPSVAAMITTMCCVCQTVLSSSNCSESQKKKDAGRRKCRKCVSSA